MGRQAAATGAQLRPAAVELGYRSLIGCERRDRLDDVGVVDGDAVATVAFGLEQRAVRQPGELFEIVRVCGASSKGLRVGLGSSRPWAARLENRAVQGANG